MVGPFDPNFPIFNRAEISYSYWMGDSLGNGVLKLQKARGEAFRIAVGSIFFGAFVLVTMAVVYLLYGSNLDAYARMEPNTEINASLIRIVKTCAFILVPSICILLILVGASTLYYLKLEARSNTPKA
jgi:hypothetical protein